MKKNFASFNSTRRVGLLLFFLYAAEGAGLLSALAWYKNGDRPFLLLLTGRYSPFFVGGTLTLLASSVYLFSRYRRAQRDNRREFWFTVAMNVVVVGALLIFGEATVRLFQSRIFFATTFMNTVLLPRSWDELIARNRALLDKAPSNISYFIPDDLLGWTIGANRQSTDGLYSSSAEGIRSARPGESYAARAPAYRIALVGDSFTFGLEVPFDESWGYQLEQEFESRIQVLNFGVDGYGVDQAYLRYWRDVRPWKPDLVIFGFINHDLYRSMVVYSFVSFPEWGFPFAKPRFAVTMGKLQMLNAPVLSPQEILARRSIFDLPFIEYDRGYNPHEWEWRPYHRSYLVRFLLSRYPPWPKQLSDVVSDEAVKVVNSEIFTSFAKLAKAEGSIPLIVYLPSRIGFIDGTTEAKESVLGVLRARGIEYEDLTSCLKRFSVSALFIEGHPHYSPKGNAAVAKCLSPIVRKHLNERRKLKGA
ncbi:MAG: SGNH/GDSL hydrolase family protein [Candidatus Binatia bacterium]